MLIKKSLFRGGIPFIIMELFATALYFQGKIEDSKNLFFGGLVFLVIGAATIIYAIDQWSLAKQSAIHFLMMLITIFPILLLSGWYPVTSLFDTLRVFGIFVSVGIGIWTFLFILAKLFKW